MKKTITMLTLLCTAVFAQQKGTFTDPRDKKTYKTVKIGNLTWFAENLNYNAKGSKCGGTDFRKTDWGEGFSLEDKNTENCNKYGRLYDWETAMKSCPTGWHLSSKEEWEMLLDAVGGRETAGKYLKAKDGWDNDYSGKSGNGQDTYGFSAMPGGFGQPNGEFYHVGKGGSWGTTDGCITADDNEYINYDRGYRNYGGGTYYYSIRCVQNFVQQKGTFIDTRDKKTYKTTKIYSQTWMAENLNYAVKGSKCIDEAREVEDGLMALTDNNTTYCKKYGRLYNWAAAKTVCPKGWHLPSKEEWDVLITSVGGEGIAGNKLKAKSGWSMSDTRDINSGNGDDTYSFSAIPGGNGTTEYGDAYGRSVDRTEGNWWSSDAYRQRMYHGNGGTDIHDDDKSYLYSVRCLQD
jgi:uncharacterized protein (TIGR02145 family)